MVALLTSVRNSPCFDGLRRTKTCHRQLFARPSTCFLVTFCTMQKVTIRSLCREHRGFPNLESVHPNNNFPLTKLKPSQRELRGSANLESAYPNNNFPLTKLNPFKESSPDKKHVSETNIRDVQKGEIHAIRAVLWEANRPKPFRCRFKVMLFRCHPWR